MDDQMFAPERDPCDPDAYRHFPPDMRATPVVVDIGLFHEAYGIQRCYRHPDDNLFLVFAKSAPLYPDVQKETSDSDIVYTRIGVSCRDTGTTMMFGRFQKATYGHALHRYARMVRAYCYGELDVDVAQLAMSARGVARDDA